MKLPGIIRLGAVILVATGPWLTVAAAGNPPASKTLVLEATTIEGKLKKPQVALIAADRRPEFKPIALTDMDAKKDVLEKIDPAVFESRIYGQPFAVDKKSD